ncbi:Bax inhibitor-1/YccA family protein [bacterium]|nr:Bax inhibitor-1/YccA family protein [bacterium]
MAQNPLLKAENFEYLDGLNDGNISYEKSIKNILPLLVTLFIVFSYVWYYGFDGYSDRLGFISFASAFIVIALVFTARSFPKFSLHMSFPFAACLGAALAGFSFRYFNLTHGVFPEMVFVTILSAFYVFLNYKPDLDNPSAKFAKIKDSALKVTFVYWILALVGILLKLGYAGLMIKGIFGFIFAPVFAGIAVYSFVMDLDLAENCARNEIPKHFEWYITLALVFSLVWQVARIPEAIKFFTAKNK